MKQKKYHGIVLSDQYYSFLYIDYSLTIFTGRKGSQYDYAEYVKTRKERFTTPTLLSEQTVIRSINQYVADTCTHSIRKYPVFMSE